MAKKKQNEDQALPYFKFFVQQWLVGNIQFCSHSSQGLFINLCVLYWAKRGDLSLAHAKKLWPRKQKHFTELVSSGVIKLSGDQVNISFLDEQLTDREVVSEKNAENALSRWNQTKSDATASQSQCETDATAIPKEENREEEKRKEEKRKEESPGVVFDYAMKDETIPTPPIIIPAKIPQSGVATFSDYETWTREVIAGNDQHFESMLMKEPFKVNGALADYAKSYLKLLAEYPKKAPPDQHRFRVALIGHISENINKGNNGQRNGTKTTVGQTDPEHGKDYKSAGGF